MTLHDYLMTEQAREDVRGLCSADGFWLINGLGRLEIAQTGAWRVLWLIGERERLAAYYRPDGDRFVVTDLGEGVRALRLRTGSVSHTYAMPGLPSLRGTKIKDGCVIAWHGDLYRGDDCISAPDLPDAICRVMLASLMVS